ncbi:MAG: hypothetical protein ACLGJD_19635 [Gammaproteobacteria bacterium]
MITFLAPFVVAGPPRCHRRIIAIDPAAHLATPRGTVLPDSRSL